MKYELIELIPIVGKLAEQYTANKSSSITYEKAEQLMGAALYCINEVETDSINSLVPNGKIEAQEAYGIGLALVKEKTEKALELYNCVMLSFCHYENQCLYDTFVKGIPEFFKWYDIRFEPQNTILTLDYPVLKDISEYTGIDKVFEYIRYICLEQKFLKLFPNEYVKSILSKSDKCWKESFDNICETVFIYVIGHMLAGKSLTEFKLQEEDYSYIQELFMKNSLEIIKKQLEDLLVVLINNYYEGDRELLDYLLRDISEIIVRLKNAVDNKVLSVMI